jgi:hypothetical protein
VGTNNKANANADALKPQPRRLPSWLAAWLAYTEAAPTPDLFRLWSGLFGISSALTRRVFTMSEHAPVFPGSFIVLCAQSGIGKGPAMEPIEKMLHAVDFSENPILRHRGLCLGGSRLTSSGLFNFLSSPRTEKITHYKGEEILFHNGVFIAEEGASILSELKNAGPGLEFGATLIQLLNAAPEIKRSLAKDDEELVRIQNPSGSILIGLQTKLLMEFFPESSWSQGLTARAIFIYSNQRKGMSIFGTEKEGHQDDRLHVRSKLEDDLIHDLEQITLLEGRFRYERPVQLMLDSWWNNGRPKDTPSHPKLESYGFKRVQHILRLCMTLSASRSNDLIVTEEDAAMALQFLREAEQAMPEMFEGTVASTSDEHIVQETLHAISAYIRTHEKPAPHYMLINFLSKKVPTERAEAIVASLLTREMIQKVKPKNMLPGQAGQKAYILASKTGE